MQAIEQASKKQRNMAQNVCQQMGQMSTRDQRHKRNRHHLLHIPKTQVPAGRTVTYAHFVCDIRPQNCLIIYLSPFLVLCSHAILRVFLLRESDRLFKAFKFPAPPQISCASHNVMTAPTKNNNKVEEEVTY